MLKRNNYFLNYDNKLFDVTLSEPTLREFLLFKKHKGNGLVMFIRPRIEYKTRYEVFINTDEEVSNQKLVYVSGNVKAETVLKVANRYKIDLV